MLNLREATRETGFKFMCKNPLGVSYRSEEGFTLNYTQKGFTEVWSLNNKAPYFKTRGQINILEIANSFLPSKTGWIEKSKKDGYVIFEKDGIELLNHPDHELAVKLVDNEEWIPLANGTPLDFDVDIMKELLRNCEEK